MQTTSEAQIFADSAGVNLQRLDVLDAYFKGLVSEGKQAFSAIRVLRRGMTVFSREYGVQSPGGSPLRADAIYNVASVTKPFTATLLAILQEDGKVDFLDRVQRYFPEFEGEGKDGVLLWHLLCHCSGMDDDAAGEFANSYIKNELGVELEDGITDDARLDAYMKARELMGLPEAKRSWDAVNEMFYILSQKAPLKTEPGTIYSYCSTGYQMLADIVTSLTGESLDAFARRKIFEPLGMEDTYWVLPKEKWDRVVKRDPSFAGGEWMNSEDALVNEGGAGGLKTTMDDLAKFGQMYLQNGTLNGARILSPASVRTIITDHNPDLPPSNWHVRVLGSNWGFGWNVKNGKKDDLGMLRSDRSYDHGGYGGARLMIDPDAELVVCMYTVEQLPDDPYPYQSRIINLIYSALD